MTALREVRLRPKIGVHDFNAKSRSARKLLVGGDKVKVTILFRGREITHPELGFKLLQRMAELMQDISVIDRQPLMENRRMMLILAPMSATKAKPKDSESSATPEAAKTAKPAPKPAAKPVQDEAPAKDKAPAKETEPVKGKTPEKEKQPVKTKAPAKAAAPAKEKEEVKEETQNA